MSDIKQIIADLLVEPIAHHFLDSGGAYGYTYERNQKDGFLTGLNYVGEWTDTDTNERTLDITIPVYDFLTYNLEKDEETIEFEKELFKEFKHQEFEPWEIFEVEEYLKTIGKIKLDITETGITSIKYENTYNYDEYVSQTLQFITFSRNEEDYVLLQVHNGCDVRSGYTYPQLFKINDIEYFLIGFSDRFCQCDCGYNDYTIYGSDDATDRIGDYISKKEIYNRTYVDSDDYVRCAECDGYIKGGFIEW